MNNLTKNSTKKLIAKAVYVAENIQTKTLELSNKIGEHPYFFPAGTNGYAALFRYGVVVFFNLNPVEEASFMSYLKDFLVKPYDTPEMEELEICLDTNEREGFKENHLIINNLEIETLQIVSLVLSKSVVLARNEQTVSVVFDKIEPYAGKLEEGKSVKNEKAIIKQIGEILNMQHKMAGQVEVAEKRELLWYRPELEKFYLQLSYDYDLKERHGALERKFKIISHTAETLLNLLNHQSSMRVEWYIVALIVVEIIFSFYQHFFK